MNKMKKFASIATAVLMTACMAAPMTMSLTASAVTTATLTSPSGIEADSISNIKAYQIFTGDYIPPTTEQNSTIIDPAELTVTGWGSGINVEAFITALKTDTTFSGKFASVEAQDNVTTAQAVSDIIGTWSNDSPMAQAFAKLAVLNKTTTAKDGTFSGGSVTFGTDVDNIDNGYYVVTCDAKAISGTDESGAPIYIDNYDSMSLGMLTVIGKNAALLQVGTGTAKVGLPEVMKKVKENAKSSEAAASINGYTETDNKWNDVADYCIGDSVPFKLYGTMPQDIANYKHYYYQFTDTLGTQFDMPTSLTIKVGNTEITATKVDTGWTTSGDTGTNCRVSVAGQVISISFEDIKAYSGVTKSTIVTVEYTAKLNNTAEIGLPGQENKVDLTYSNNPNFSYKPNINDETEDTPDTPDKPGENTGKTPEDKVIVFTYEADFTKVDGVTKAPLAGAVFQLKNSDDKYAVVEDGILVGWSDTEITTGADGLTDITSAINGTFKIVGLDDGTYTLVEKTAPEGYNPIGDTTVIITAGTENNQTWSGTASDALTSFKYKVGTADEVTGDVNEGIAEGTIENKKGSSLPSTGGIGTTLFYVGGGAMVAVAGVFLITKKRMGKKED